jgi:hypothetical protein
MLLGLQVDEATSTVVLDTNAGQWVSPLPGGPSGEDFTRRCRHAVASVGPFVFIYGGLKGSQLLDDLLVRRLTWFYRAVCWTSYFQFPEC